MDLLQKVTSQLDNLSISLVQGVQAPQQPPPPPSIERRNDASPQRRPQRREYFCHNCGEDGHGMYFCPHPRRYPGNGQGRGPRRQVTPPRDRPPMPPQSPPQNFQILRQPQTGCCNSNLTRGLLTLRGNCEPLDVEGQ